MAYSLIERSLISERTRAGVKAARARGVKFGRKRKLQPAQIAHARKQIEKGHRQEDVAALFNVNRSTLYRARRTLKMTRPSREIIARRMWESTSKRWLFPTPKTETRGDVPITKLNGPFNKIVEAREVEDDQPARPALDFVLYDLRHRADSPVMPTVSKGIRLRAVWRGVPCVAERRKSA